MPDFIVDGLVIADPKVATAVDDIHLAQMIGYLNITGLKLARLLTFKNVKLDWKRVARRFSSSVPSVSSVVKSARRSALVFSAFSVVGPYFVSRHPLLDASGGSLRSPLGSTRQAGQGLPVLPIVRLYRSHVPFRS